MLFAEGKLRALGAVAALGAALVLSPLAANAQTVVKLAHSEGEGDLLANPYWAFTQVFDSVLKNGTSGRYQLQVFPNGQLGDNDSLTEQVARGVIQIAAGMSAGQLASFWPSSQVLEVPYSFASTDEALRVLNGSFGEEMSDAVAENTGIRILSYLPSAFRNFSSSKKLIKSPADMVGQKIRVQSVPVHLTMVEALGASPTPIAWAELYNALQTGVVDGQENAPYTMLLSNLQEVQKYYTLDNHLLNLAVVLVNEDFYNGMSKEDRMVLNQAARTATTAFLGIVKAKESQDLKTIAEAGVEIYRPSPEEFQQFVDKARKPVRELLAKTVDAAWFDKLDAAIADARKQAEEDAAE